MIQLQMWIGETSVRPGRDEESGVALVEYSLIIAFISVIVIAALVLLGPEMTETFNKVSSTISA